jgi:hypothetical protein
LDQQRLTAGPMFVDGTAAEEEIQQDALICRCAVGSVSATIAFALRLPEYLGES